MEEQASICRQRGRTCLEELRGIVGVSVQVVLDGGKGEEGKVKFLSLGHMEAKSDGKQSKSDRYDARVSGEGGLEGSISGFY